MVVKICHGVGEAGSVEDTLLGLSDFLVFGDKPGSSGFDLIWSLLGKLMCIFCIFCVRYQSCFK